MFPVFVITNNAVMIILVHMHKNFSRIYAWWNCWSIRQMNVEPCKIMTNCFPKWLNWFILSATHYKNFHWCPSSSVFFSDLLIFASLVDIRCYFVVLMYIALTTYVIIFSPVYSPYVPFSIKCLLINFLLGCLGNLSLSYWLLEVFLFSLLIILDFVYYTLKIPNPSLWDYFVCVFFYVVVLEQSSYF